MKTPLLIITGLLFFCLIGMAQESSYDISTYKLPDISRKQLDFNFDLSGNSVYAKNDAERTYHNYSNQMNLLYYGFSNTRALQKGQTFRLNMYSQWYKSKQNSASNYSNNKNFSPQLYYSISHRNYKTERKFIEWNVNTNLSYAFNKDDWRSNNSSNNSENQRFKYFVNVPLKIGVGRIEEVQDARQAIYILDELSKVNRITKSLDENGITEFANLISSLQNERFFDYRLQKIKELAALDSFFRDKSLVEPNDMIYFSTLNDFWQFGRQQTRMSGLRSSFAIYPGLSYYYMKEGVENTYDIDNGTTYSESSFKFTNLSINTGYELIYEKPLSLSKQSSTEFSFLLGWIQSSEKDSDSKLKLPNAQLNFEQRFGIYPNTRTDFTWFFGGSLVKTIDFTGEDDTDFGVDGMGALAKTGITFNYYISPQLRLNAAWDINYIWQENDEQLNYNYLDLMDAEYIVDMFVNELNNYTSFNKHELNNYLNIKLTYSFF